MLKIAMLYIIYLIVALVGRMLMVHPNYCSRDTRPNHTTPCAALPTCVFARVMQAFLPWGQGEEEA